MAYATAADMEQRFGISEMLLLADPERTGEVDATIVDTAINDATAEVDSYLACVLTEPLETIPTFLVSITCDIARYRLYSGLTCDTVQVKERYDDAIVWLNNVAKGRARLGITGATATPTTASSMAFGTRTLQMSDSKLETYSSLTTTAPPYF